MTHSSGNDHHQLQLQTQQEPQQDPQNVAPPPPPFATHLQGSAAPPPYQHHHHHHQQEAPPQASSDHGGCIVKLSGTKLCRHWCAGAGSCLLGDACRFQHPRMFPPPAPRAAQLMRDCLFRRPPPSAKQFELQYHEHQQQEQDQQVQEAALVKLQQQRENCQADNTLSIAELHQQHLQNEIANQLLPVDPTDTQHQQAVAADFVHPADFLQERQPNNFSKNHHHQHHHNQHKRPHQHHPHRQNNNNNNNNSNPKFKPRSDRARHGGNDAPVGAP